MKSDWSRYSAHRLPNRYGECPPNFHDAIKRAGEHIAAGFRWIVSIDLEKFFDRVNHDILMSLVARRVKDKKLLLLIRRYLQAGIMDNGVMIASTEGTSQGSPLSPLLSNIMLDVLDKELTRREHRFCRFADDANAFVRTKRAGLRVLDLLERFLWDTLRLRINKEKSAVVPPREHTFLGYSFYKTKTLRARIAPKSLKRFKDKFRKRLRRWRGMKITVVIKELNLMTRGWIVYFRLADAREKITELESWILHHLRCILWRQWKKPRTRFNSLIALGVNQKKAARAAWGRSGPWYSSATSAMNYALRKVVLKEMGWHSPVEMYDHYKINVNFV